MILDRLSNAYLYEFPNPRISQGLKFLQSPDMPSLPLGRTDIDGDHLFAIMQEYPTRPGTDCIWEAHRKYIDIQYLLSGEELIGYAPAPSLRISQPYNASLDRQEFTGQGLPLRLQAGMFAVFFPHDAHQPCVAADSSQTVKKIVIKVAV